MHAESKLLNELFIQQRELNAQQNKISQQLVEVQQKIQYLLALHANRAAGNGSAVAIAAPIDGRAGKSNGLRKNGARHSWFDRGEAIKLICRTARRSMRPAQVVHAVMDAKGYSATLVGADKKRAQAAIHQAVISAVKAGALMRDRAGAVRVKA
jgi:hypothetical protein